MRLPYSLRRSIPQMQFPLFGVTAVLSRRRHAATKAACYTWWLQNALKETAMAKHCEICGKTPVVGRTLSHAHNVRARRFEPNLQRLRALVNGGVRRIRVCTRCIRSGKVTKAA
jgi:large subunit ribosomal protein L28